MEKDFGMYIGREKRITGKFYLYPGDTLYPLGAPYSGGREGGAGRYYLIHEARRDHLRVFLGPAEVGPSAREIMAGRVGDV